MPKLVALLRGINVGGHRKVPMAELRSLCSEIGFAEVATYIQSGNVVFSSRLGAAPAAAKLAEAIAGRFGFPVDVVVRTADAWAACADANPFPAESAAEPSRVMLYLTRDPIVAAGAEALTARGRAAERFVAVGDAVWAHFPQGAGSSNVTSATIDRALGSPATARNWKTVVALQRMLEGVG